MLMRTPVLFLLLALFCLALLAPLPAEAQHRHPQLLYPSKERVVIFAADG